MNNSFTDFHLENAKKLEEKKFVSRKSKKKNYLCGMSYVFESHSLAAFWITEAVELL